MSLTSLTASVRSLSRREPLGRCSSRRTIYWGVLCLSMINLSPATGVEKIDINAFKLYAHSRIIDHKQYICFVNLIDKENISWNPLSVGNLKGNHRVYGIGQMKNDKYRALDAYTQIDWTLRYIKGRYQTPCKAWAFFKANGYH